MAVNNLTSIQFSDIPAKIHVFFIFIYLFTITKNTILYVLYAWSKGYFFPAKEMYVYVGNRSIWGSYSLGQTHSHTILHPD